MSRQINDNLRKFSVRWESIYIAINVVESVAQPARLSLLFLTGVGALLPAVSSVAGPQGGVVVSGQANISANGFTTNINQSTNQAIINWQLFSIAPKETVNFNQPSTTSVTLNRVIGNEKSVIEGALNANGQVFIVNSAGVVFTKSAQVNVGGLVASTLDISNSNFLAGKYQFSGQSKASVTNYGNIQANPGGYVALLGSTVSNQGTITATMGTVAMASGEQVTLNIGGNALVDVTTDKGTLNALVENKGAIVADGGKVILTARAADALLSAQVNNTGVIQARTMAGLTGGQTRTGSIKLLSTGGKVKVAGRLDASAPNGGNGGTIETSGAKVSVANDAVVTTDAPKGKKGLWLLDPDGFTIAASGGDITGAALSDDLSTTNVTILSTQGSGTDGNINVNDTVTWSGGATLQLSATNSVNVNAPISWTDGALTLNAGQNVNVNAVMTATGAGNFAANYGYVLDASGNPTATQTPGTNPDGTPYGLYTGLASTGGYAGQISFANSSGVVTLNGQGYAVINSQTDLDAAAGNPSGNYVLGSDIALSSLADIPTFTGNYNGFGHSLPVSFATALSVDAPISIPSLQNTNVVLNPLGDISINAPVTFGAGLLTLNAGYSLNVNAPITSTDPTAGLVVNGYLLNVNVTNAFNVPRIGGTIYYDATISQSQAWTTAPDLTRLTVQGNYNVNAPLSWSTGALTLVGGIININAPVTWSSGAPLTLTAAANISIAAPITGAGLVLTTGLDANVIAANVLNVPTVSGTVGRNFNFQKAQSWTTAPDLSGLTALNNLGVNAPLTWSTGSLTLSGTNININAPVTWGADTPLTLNAANNINIAAPITATGAGASLALSVGADVNVNAVNVLNVPTILGTINHDLNIQQAQAWMTAPDLTGLAVINDVNINAPVTWSTGGLTFAAGANININAPVSWSGGTLTLNAGQNVEVNTVMTASGTANFVANYGSVPGVNPDGTPYGLYTALNSTGAYIGRIDFSGAGGVTLNGQNYTVINSAADLNAAANNPSGNYVLGSTVSIAGLAEIPAITGNFDGFGHALPVAAASTLSIDAPLSIASLKNTDVILNSSGAISINAPVTSGAGLLTFNAGGAINLNTSSISTSNSAGSFAFNGGRMALDTTASVSGVNLFLNAPTSWSSSAALTLAATNNIYINSSITASGANAGLTLSYGGDYVLKDQSTTITLSGANPDLWINGTQYTVITTLAQLAAISPDANTPANGSYALGTDIYAGGATFVGPVVWDLEGTLAGFNHRINNFTINDQTAINTLNAVNNPDALIGQLGSPSQTSAVVRDVGMFNTNVFNGPSLVYEGSTLVGNYGGPAAALVSSNSGTIRNSYAIGGSISGAFEVGGLVSSNSGVISNSYANLAVSGQTDVGGLVGFNSGSIDHSAAYGPVTGTGYALGSTGWAVSTNIGGLVGINFGTISNSLAAGSVTGTNSAEIGGLVGANFFGSISNSSATGSVAQTITFGGQDLGSFGTGGLVGDNLGGSISGSQASGNVTVASLNPEQSVSNAGGLVGINQFSGSVDGSSATGAVTGSVGTVFNVGGLAGSSDAFSTVTNSTASGYVAVGEYGNAALNTGGLIGSAQGLAGSYSGNSWSVSGTGQANAAGAAPGTDSTAGATGTNPPPPAGPAATPNFTSAPQPLVEQSSAANTVATVDTTYSAAAPPRPRIAASAGTGKTSALAGPSFSDLVSAPTNQTEGEWLQNKQAIDAANARARAASLSPPSRSNAAEAKEAPPPRRHAFTPPPRPVAKPKGAGFGATIHSIEIEGKQYELHDKPGGKPETPGTKPQAPEVKPETPESKPQAPGEHN
jgi:filamentous hemagglutinin family protein